MDRHSKEGVMVLALLGLLLLLLGLLALAHVAPFFSAFLVAMILLAYWYIADEKSSIHSAQEIENRVVTLIAFLFSTCVFFIEDSPLAIGRLSPSAGVLGVILFTFGIHIHDRQKHRARASRTPTFPWGHGEEAKVEQEPSDDQPDVQEMVDTIHAHLEKIDNKFVATNIAYMADSARVISLEGAIIDVISSCTRTELNRLIPKIKLGLIFYKVKDRSGARHRTKLLEILAKERLSDLDVRSRAHVLDALQVMMLSAHNKSGHYALSVLKATKGDDLSLLKSLTDSKGDFHSLHKLVYTDITNKETRESVLAHIAKEARTQEAHMKMNTRGAKRRSGMAWRKILSDVDDTITSSGGHFPAGADRMYPRQAIYPGVLDFFRELDLGTEGSEEWTKGRVGNLVLLSARPHFYKDMSEQKTYQKLQKLQEERNLYTIPTLLAGSIDTGKDFVLGDTEPMARKKFENFREYLTLYPEFKYIFVGDNGQGDVRAAEMMIEASPRSMEAVYMHQVIPMNMTYGYKGPESIQKWREIGIVFFRNYVEAAMDAFQRKLIRVSGLARICKQVVCDFDRVKWKDPRDADSQRLELNGSLGRAKALLESQGYVEGSTLADIAAVCIYPPGSEVEVKPFGRGLITGFRPKDGVYAVLLRPKTAAEESTVEDLGGKSYMKLAQRKSTSPSTSDKEEQFNVMEEGGSELQSEADREQEDDDDDDDPKTPKRTFSSPHRYRSFSKTPPKLVRANTLNYSSSCFKSSRGGGIRAYVQLGALREAKRDDRAKKPRVPKGPAHGGIFQAILGGSSSSNSSGGGSLGSPVVKRPLAKGSCAVCVLGDVTVCRFRERDGIYEVELINWELRNGKRAVGYIHSSNLMPKVLVPRSSSKTSPSLLGKMRILGTKFSLSGSTDGKEVVENLSAPTKLLQEGDEIETQFGAGLIVKVRGGQMAAEKGTSVAAAPTKRASVVDKGSDAPVYVVKLTSWKMADGKCATAYLSRESVELRRGETALSALEKRKSSVSAASSSSASSSAVFGFLSMLTPSRSRQVATDGIPASMESQTAFPVGSLLLSPFGLATVTGFRAAEGVGVGLYEVDFLSWHLANGKCARGVLNANSAVLHGMPQGTVAEAAVKLAAKGAM